MSGTRVAPRIADGDMAQGVVPQIVATGEGEVSVRDFLLFLWRSRWSALIGMVTCAIIAAGAAWIITPEYTATTVLLPVAGHSGALGGGSLGSGVSELSGLASLAGLNLGGMGAQKAQALATLQSRVLTDQFIREHDLLPVLFPKQWNSATKTWRSSDPRKIPTLWDADQLFKKIRVVDDHAKTGIVTFSIRWKNADSAAAWANGLVKLTNDYLRLRAINESERSIAYLNQEVSKTNIVEVKNAIYGFMEAEIKNEMVAKGRRDYALRVIDPAVAPERPNFPRPLLWIIGGAIGGSLLGFLVSILRETMADEGSAAVQDAQVPAGGDASRGLQSGTNEV
jgi:uncharacterized protein involved in exopolysaccharide biosynthesis